ncbi:MAG: terminase small subunit [Mucilaginibacter sp.]|uniref:terminase small subunit n=1 Tax=Mucilaginibacter sp. TaxID=1882438 RepID=UPI003266BDD2
MSTYLQEFLTPKQQVFCDEYLTDMNATRAALVAGYARSVALNGQVMLMPKIQMYLKSRMEDRSAKAKFSADRVLEELGKIAFGNMADYFDSNGDMKAMHEIADDAKAALWSVSVGDAGSGSTATGGMVKFRMYNKLAALDKIAKHIGMYKPEVMKREVVYQYMSEYEMNRNEWFEGFEDEEMKTLKETQESGCNNQEGGLEQTQESGCKNQDEVSLAHKAESVKQDEGSLKQEEYVPVGEDGEVLCDGAGIPYGAVRKIFRFDLEESVEENMARMRLYEAGDYSKAESLRARAEAAVEDGIDHQVQIHLELDGEFKRLGVPERNYSDLCLIEKMKFIEVVRKKVA